MYIYTCRCVCKDHLESSITHINVSHQSACRKSSWFGSGFSAHRLPHAATYFRASSDTGKWRLPVTQRMPKVGTCRSGARSSQALYPKEPKKERLL